MVKSISVRILIDLFENDNHAIDYLEILDNYLLKDSFYRRVDILISNGMISFSDNYLSLTKKGKKFIYPITLIQKLFQIKLSG